MQVHYHFEGVELLIDQLRINKWLKLCLRKLDQQEADITYIFCNDSHILKLNRESLNHNYYTDIITFDNRLSPEQPIFADLFISTDTVAANAERLTVGFLEELQRVMIHGILHLCGFNDKSESEQKAMREKENEMLSLYV